VLELPASSRSPSSPHKIYDYKAQKKEARIPESHLLIFALLIPPEYRGHFIGGRLGF